MLRILIIITVLTLGSQASAQSYASGSDNFSTGCATVEFMAKMVALNIVLPGNADDTAQLNEMQKTLKELNRRVCQSVLLTDSTRYNSYYGNGTRISADLYYAPWYFPNGQLFMSAVGRDASIYYPNGRALAHHWNHGGEPVYWANGQTATYRFRVEDQTWYYPDGNIITYEAGMRGGRWFYPILRLDGRVGQELISSNWGDDNEYFNYLNFNAQGVAYITRERIRRKLSLSDSDLLDVPGVLLLITRLYQVDDDARLFVPADANITGAPY